MKTRGDSFYIYGKKPVEEQLMRNPENVVRIFISDTMAKKDGGFHSLRDFAKEQKIPINPISKTKILEYVGEVNDQGVIALIKRPEYQDFDDWFNNLKLEENPAVVILDHIEDVHNFGAIIRTSAAAGASGIIVAKDHQAPVNGTVYKTSAGTLVHVPIIRVSNINQIIERLKNNKFWVAALDASDKPNDTLWNHRFDTPMAFVVGREGKGVSLKTKELVDFIISIPMSKKVESLNVSVATAIVLYEWKRQRP